MPIASEMQTISFSIEPSENWPNFFFDRFVGGNTMLEIAQLPSMSGTIANRVAKSKPSKRNGIK